ncbi:MAG: hypothetical protein J6Y78_09575 [Paludibacteraceae bacterium]|nr:hypothetical protein [Paludibacteraceae bacterium]
MRVQIFEDESLLDGADFENADVWILNRTNSKPLDPRIVNIQELTESTLPENMKFPQLFTEIADRYFNEGLIPSDFSYEVYTRDPNKYLVQYYVCDMESFRIPADNNNLKEVVIDEKDN